MLLSRKPLLHQTTTARRASTQWLAIISLAVLLLFGWLMVRRLAICPRGIQADFVQEWTSARNYWTGRPIYLPLAESFQAYFGPGTQTDLKVNAHPPMAVVIALPLGLLDYRTAWLTWNLLSLALLACCVWMLAGGPRIETAYVACAPLAALLLASNPLAQQVIEGQMNLLLLVLIAGAWLADCGERPKLAGALVGLAAGIKLYPAFLIVYFVARRQWTAVAAAAAAFFATCLLALGLFGGDIFLVYFRDVLPQFQHYGNNLGNASLAGLWSKALVGIPGQVLPWIAAPHALRATNVGTGLVLAAACGWMALRASAQRGRARAYSAAVIGMLLASPITWGHSFVLLLLPLALLWQANERQLWTRGAIAAACALLWIVRPNWIWNAVVPGFHELTLGLAPADYAISPAWSLTLLSFPTYALLLLFGTALVGDSKSTRSKTAST